MEIKYAYLIGCFIFSIPFVYYFFKLKELRKEMILMGIFVGLGSVVSAYLWWTIDWWKPQTITGTRVGIEDFILRFFNGGVVAVVYENLYYKKLRKIFPNKIKKKALLKGVFVIIIVVFILSFLFWILHLTSAISCVLAMSVGVCIIWFYRRDLIKIQFLVRLS